MANTDREVFELGAYTKNGHHYLFDSLIIIISFSPHEMVYGSKCGLDAEMPNRYSIMSWRGGHSQIRRLTFVPDRSETDPKGP